MLGDPARTSPSSHVVITLGRRLCAAGSSSSFCDGAVEQIDLSAIHASYSKTHGCKSYDPAMLLRWWIYGYVEGVRRSRKLEDAGVAPHIAKTRRSTTPMPKHRITAPFKRMLARMATATGKAIYGTRKSTVAPVFGTVKQTMGLRPFHLRGLNGVAIEWHPATAWHLKRLHSLCSRIPP